jgi:hypothetical protein
VVEVDRVFDDRVPVVGHLLHMAGNVDAHGLGA